MQQIFELFSKPGRLLMYLQFSVYDSPIPATFVRVPTVEVLLRADYTESTDDTGAFVRTWVKGHLARFTVVILKWRPQEAYLLTSSQNLFPMKINGRVKTMNIPSIFASKAVKNIPTALGLFDDIEKCALVLILAPAGVPIADKDQLSAAVQYVF
jgi:hypothetical protein